MPSKPDYFHKLDLAVTLLGDQVEALRRQADNLGKTAESLKQGDVDLRRELLNDSTTKTDGLKDAVASIRSELAVMKQQLADQIKKVEEWDRRWWGFVVILVGALLSLAAGLIVSLVRR